MSLARRKLLDQIAAAAAGTAALQPRRRIGLVGVVDYANQLMTVDYGQGAIPGVAWCGDWLPRSNDLVVVLEVPGEQVALGRLGPRPDQLLQAADVTAAETTSSTTYTDLATLGPQLANVYLSVGQQCLVTVSSVTSVGTASMEALASFDVAGATTLAVADGNSAWYRNGSINMRTTVTRSTVFTATASGLHTFTMRYRVATVVGSGAFQSRRLIVDPR